ncbi:MAG: DUF87 domain-containing protein [Actinomycetota bacterium]|nr:DUF87 domain-containing protein [Actinomycetota bacterium]
MGINIAVAGKGGTGKTTLCGLIIRGLIEGGKHPVLALDADPEFQSEPGAGRRFGKHGGDAERTV